MKITLVKKILPDGSPCRKCVEVQSRLEDSGYMDRIDHVLLADEREDHNEGLALARRLNVDRAPFFVVEHEDGREDVYTVFFKFMREVLEPDTEKKP